MTREQEIKQASIEYTYKNRPMCIGGGAFSEVMDEMNRNHAFEEGAEWADATMLDKVCKWLGENVEYAVMKKNGKHTIELACVELVEDLQKDMRI